MADEFELLQATMDVSDVIEAAQEAATAIESIAAAADEASASANAGFANMGNMMADAAAEADQYAQRIAVMADEMENASFSAASMSPPIQKTTDVIKAATATTEEHRSSLGLLGQAFGDTLDSGMSFLSGMLEFQALSGVADAIANFTSNIFGMNQMFETLHAQLTSITGSAGVATSMMQWVQTFGRSIPDTTANLAQAVVTIQSLGVNAEDFIPSLENVAAAMGVDLPTAAMAFSSAFEGRFAMMQYQLHITKEQLEQFGLELNSKGQVINETLVPAFEKLAQSRFPDGITNAMHTMKGQLSNLTDQLQFFAMNLGQPIYNMAEDGLFVVVSWMQSHYDDIQNFAHALGEIPAEGLQKLVDAIGTAIGWIGDIIDLFKKTDGHSRLLQTGILSVVFSALVPLVDALGNAAAAAEPFIIAIGEGVGWVGTFATGVGELAGIIFILAGSLVAAYNQFKPVRDATDVVVKAFKDLWNEITTNIGPLLKQLGDQLKQEFMPIWKEILDTINQNKETFALLGALIGSVLVVAIGLLIGAFKGLVQMLGPFLSGMITLAAGIVQTVLGLVNMVLPVVRGFLDIIRDLFLGRFGNLGNDLKKMFGGIWQGILQVLGGVGKMFVGLFTSIFGGLWGFIQGFVSGIGKFFSQIAQHVTPVKNALNGMKTAWKNVVDWIESAWKNTVNFVSTTLGNIGGFFSTVGGIIKTAFLWVWQQLKPAIEPTIKALQENVGPILNGLGKVFQNIGSIASNAFAILGKSVKGAIDGFKQIAPFILPVIAIIGGPLTLAIHGIIDLVKRLIPIIGGIVHWFATVVDWGKVLGSILKTTGDFFGFLGRIILGIVVGAFKAIVDWVKGLIAGFGHAIGGIVQFATGLVRVIVGAWQILTSIVATIFVAIKDIVTGNFTHIQHDAQEKMQGMIDGLKNIWNGLVSMAKGIWQALVESIKSIVGGLINAVIDFFTSLWDKLVGHSIIPDMVSGIINTIAKLPGEVLKHIMNLVHMVLSAIQAFAGQVMKWVVNMVVKFLAEVLHLRIQVIQHILLLAIKFIQAIIDLRQRIIDKVKELVSGFINYIVNLRNDIIDKIKKLVSDFVDLIEAIRSGSVQKIKDAVSQMLSDIGKFKDDILQRVGDIVNGILNFFKNLPAQLLQSGKDMMNNFINGIKSIDLGSVLSGIGKTITSFLGFSLPEKGPLAQADKWMPDFGDLLVNGLKQQMGKIQSVTGNIANAMKIGLNPGLNGLSPAAQSGAGLGAGLPQGVIPQQNQTAMLLNQLAQALKTQTRMNMTPGSSPQSAALGSLTQQIGNVNIQGNISNVNDLYQMLTRLAGVAQEYSGRGAWVGLGI